MSDFHESWLTAYLDDELSKEERRLVESKLEQDDLLRELLVELQEVRALVAGLKDERLDADLTPYVLGRITQVVSSSSIESETPNSTQLDAEKGSQSKPTVVLGQPSAPPHKSRAWLWLSAIVAASLTGALFYVQPWIDAKLQNVAIKSAPVPSDSKVVGSMQTDPPIAVEEHASKMKSIANANVPAREDESPVKPEASRKLNGAPSPAAPSPAGDAKPASREKSSDLAAAGGMGGGLGANRSFESPTPPGNGNGPDRGSTASGNSSPAASRSSLENMKSPGNAPSFGGRGVRENNLSENSKKDIAALPDPRQRSLDSSASSSRFAGDQDLLPQAASNVFWYNGANEPQKKNAVQQDSNVSPEFNSIQRFRVDRSITNEDLAKWGFEEPKLNNPLDASKLNLQRNLLRSQQSIELQASNLNSQQSLNLILPEEKIEELKRNIVATGRAIQPDTENVISSSGQQQRAQSNATQFSKQLLQSDRPPPVENPQQLNEERWILVEINNPQ